MSRGRQGAVSLGESTFRRGVGGRRSEERVRCGSSVYLWEAGEMGWASTMLSILQLKEGLREESWEGAGSGNTRYVQTEGGLDLPDPLPL